VQTITNVAPKQFLTVVEHQETVAVSLNLKSVARSAAGEVDLALVGDTGLRYLFEGSVDLAHWSRLGVRTNLIGGIRFIDTRATNLPKRFYRVSIP